MLSSFELLCLLWRHIVVNCNLHILPSEDLVQYGTDLIPLQAIDATAYAWYCQLMDVILDLQQKRAL